MIKLENLLVVNFKLFYIEVMFDRYLKLIFEIKIIFIELLWENDIEISVYLCLMENNCENFMLCIEIG